MFIFVLEENTYMNKKTHSLSSSEAEHSLKHDFWEKENFMLRSGKKEEILDPVHWEKLIHIYKKNKLFFHKITFITILWSQKQSSLEQKW